MKVFRRILCFPFFLVWLTLYIVAVLFGTIVNLITGEEIVEP
jgi:hypothetical protein